MERWQDYFFLPPYFYEISEKPQKSLIREQKVFFQSSLYGRNGR
jgi:hypothetical protein